MELDTKYEITVDTNEVSCYGTLGIFEFLEDEGLPLLPLMFPIGRWMIPTGEYRGKLPNRIGGFYKKTHDIKLTTKQRETIGNIARSCMLPDTEYTFDFVDEFDWYDGDFGDRGSCYWTDRSLARSVLQEEGALAIRFYTDKDNGRAWLYNLADGIWILFNAYGLPAPAAAAVLAKYLTQDTGKQWNYMELDSLKVNGSVIGLVYINRRPQIIFTGDGEPQTMVDLEWSEYVECGHCERWTLDVDTYNIDGERLCPLCIQEYTECDRCGEMFPRDDMYLLEEEFYCIDCHDERKEELRLERLEMRQDAAKIIQHAKDLVSSLTYDEQIAAGQLEFRFAIQMNIEERSELETLRAQVAADGLFDSLSSDKIIAIDYAHQEAMLVERLAIARSRPYRPGIRSPGAEAPA